MKTIKKKVAVDPLWAWLLILFLPLSLGAIVLLGIQFGNAGIIGAIAFILLYGVVTWFVGKRADRRMRDAGTA